MVCVDPKVASRLQERADEAPPFTRRHHPFRAEDTDVAVISPLQYVGTRRQEEVVLQRVVSEYLKSELPGCVSSHITPLCNARTDRFNQPVVDPATELSAWFGVPPNYPVGSLALLTFELKWPQSRVLVITSEVHAWRQTERELLGARARQRGPSSTPRGKAVGGSGTRGAPAAVQEVNTAQSL